MKVIKLIIFLIILNGLWADVIVLKDGKKVDCQILTAVNDSLITINYKTEQDVRIIYSICVSRCSSSKH